MLILLHLELLLTMLCHDLQRQLVHLSLLWCHNSWLLQLDLPEDLLVNFIQLVELLKILLGPF